MGGVGHGDIDVGVGQVGAEEVLSVLGNEDCDSDDIGTPKELADDLIRGSIAPDSILRIRALAFVT